MKRQEIIENPKAWAEALNSTLASLYQVFDLAAERPLPPVIDGCRVYYEETGKTCFQVSGQFERPGEFLQVLLDMLRMLYSPDVVGTFHLNANPSFIFDALPDKGFRLGYATLLSDPGESFHTFLESKFLPRLAELGYQISTCSAAFFALCCGIDDPHPELRMVELCNESSAALNTGFSLDEAISLIKSELDGDVLSPRKQVYAGYAFDEALGERLRASVWLIDEPLRLQ
jgi:hypothetical protein